MNDRLERALEEVKEEMNKTDTENEPENNNPEETPVKSTAKKVVKKKTTAVKKTTAKKVAKPAAVDDGNIKLRDVAKELKIDARDARKILRKEKIKNPGRWSWPDKSAELKKVRDLLSKTK